MTRRMYSQQKVWCIHYIYQVHTVHSVIHESNYFRDEDSIILIVIGKM